MMLDVKQVKSFKKDLKQARKQNRNLRKMTEIVVALATGTTLPEKNKDHPLLGKYIGKRECHIEPDWLLIYEIDKELNIIYLIRLGSHNDLF